LVGDGIIKTGCVIQQEWSELRKKYGMENTFPRGQTTPFVSFTKTFLLTIIPSVKRKKRRYRKFERLNVRRLCNSNRYGKDKTVVIAMGRGKRQNDLTSDSTRFEEENTQLPDKVREKHNQ
jgi:hypothetical protein